VPFTIALFLLLSAAGGQSAWSGAVPGDVARAVAHGRIEPARLQVGRGECLLVEDGDVVAAYRLDSVGLGRIGTVPLPRLPEQWSVALRWCRHEIAPDSVEELLVAQGNSLWRFRWVDSTPGLIGTLCLPSAGAWIEDFVFADIDGDGTQEAVIAAADRRPADRDDVPEMHQLLVCRPAGDSLQVVWTDQGAFELECASSVMPPSRLLGFWDVRNVGRPELLYEEAESSVGPCTFEAYEWRDVELVLARRFRLAEDCLFAPGVPDTERFWYVTAMSPAVEDGRTRLRVCSVDDRFYSGDRTTWVQQIKLHGDTVVSAATLLSGDKERSFSLDPDGNGHGVLEFIGDTEKDVRFQFWR
jgi:hypothetical protein